jgi:serine/threonine-protein phosphatase PGAM5
VPSTLLYLVRHAEQRHCAAGDDPDGGLSGLGEQQAALLGRRLADVPFDVLRHSPLRRAQETARILAGYLPGVPVSCCELLRDRTPVPSADQATAIPARYRSFLDGVPAAERDPGGAHLSAAVEQLASTGAEDRCELLVTHNFVIGWFVRHALDAPAWRWIGLNQFSCALTVIQVTAGLPPMQISFNDLGHLPVDLRGRPPIALRS